MFVTYDKFEFYDRPSITLCNPDETQLYSLGNSKNTKLSLKYNALSEYSFELAKTIQDQNGNNINDPAYDFLKAKRLILIGDEIGYFLINDVIDERDNENPIKKVNCTSRESELITKPIESGMGASVKFYDPVSPTGTFLYLALNDTGWSIGDIDPDLWNLYRDFSESSSTNVYNLLMNTAATAYGCIFTFDTVEKTVNAVSVDNAGSSTDIFLSFENLLKSTSLKEISEEVTTMLSVYGGGGLDIRSVNPLGTNKIYDFSYYQTRDSNGQLQWITESLNTAINNWIAKINANQANYSNLLVQLKNKNQTLATYQADLVDLNSQLSALTEVKKVRVEQGLDLTDINNQIAAKNAEITSKNAQINSTQLQINSIVSQISIINTNLSLTNTANFTLSQQAQLKPLIIGNVYQNENIIITDNMTNAQVQDQAQELYNQAKSVLSRTSQPRYELNVDSANFVMLKEYSTFTSQLELGSTVTIQHDSDDTAPMIITALLEINLSFDDPLDFSLVFSNRLRLDNGSFINSDLINQFNGTSSTVSFNSSDWSGFSNNKNDLLYIDSILNAANNQIINSSNQEITLNSYGLIGKKLLSNGTYSGNQVWLTNSVLAFTDDGFQTSKLALGSINLPGGGTAFGLAAGAIFGNLIAGNQLRISNANNNFVLDSNGAVLTDATFTITSSATRPNSIILSPTQGIIIKNKVGTTVFGANGDGNLTLNGTVYATAGQFSGEIRATSGFIGNSANGLTITGTGISTSTGNYLRGNDMKWGPLTISGSTGTFAGSFSASQLNGQINGGTQIQAGTITSSRILSLSADLINAGTINGINVYGSIMGWGGTLQTPIVLMYGDANGVGYFKSNNSVQLFVHESDDVKSSLFLTKDLDGYYNASLYSVAGTPIGSKGKIFIGIGQNVVKISGALDLSDINGILVPGASGLGWTGTVQVNTNSVNGAPGTGGVKTFTYKSGFLVSVS